MTSPLTLKLQEHIKSSEEPVSMTYLLNRLQKNYDIHTSLEALKGLHRLRAVRKTTKGDEVYYVYQDSKPTLPRAPQSVKHPYTKEERAYAKLIWDTCTFVTNEEHTCATNKWEGDRCQFLVKTPADYELYMIDTYGVWTYKRMKENNALSI